MYSYIKYFTRFDFVISKVTEADEVSDDTTTNLTSFKYHNLVNEDEEGEEDDEEEDCTIDESKDMDFYAASCEQVSNAFLSCLQHFFNKRTETLKLF